MLQDFIKAHRQVLEEIERVKKSEARSLEDFMLKDANLRALELKASQIRQAAKAYKPQPPEKIVDKVLKRWKKEAEPSPEVNIIEDIYKARQLDKYQFADPNKAFEQLQGVK
jgi:DNA repair ATPase RecN